MLKEAEIHFTSPFHLPRSHTHINVAGGLQPCMKRALLAGASGVIQLSLKHLGKQNDVINDLKLSCLTSVDSVFVPRGCSLTLPMEAAF
jgi:hypothetical protein